MDKNVISRPKIVILVLHSEVWVFVTVAAFGLPSLQPILVYITSRFIFELGHKIPHALLEHFS